MYLCYPGTPLSSLKIGIGVTVRFLGGGFPIVANIRDKLVTLDTDYRVDHVTVAPVLNLVNIQQVDGGGSGLADCLVDFPDAVLTDDPVTDGGG